MFFWRGSRAPDEEHPSCQKRAGEKPSTERLKKCIKEGAMQRLIRSALFRMFFEPADFASDFQLISFEIPGQTCSY
jgi:hypothetical protein